MIADGVLWQHADGTSCVSWAHMAGSKRAAGKELLTTYCYEYALKTFKGCLYYDLAHCVVIHLSEVLQIIL